MLSFERKRELEAIFYEEQTPMEMTPEEQEYWDTLLRHWNETLDNLLGRIAEADERAGGK